MAERRAVVNTDNSLQQLLRTCLERRVGTPVAAELAQARIWFDTTLARIRAYDGVAARTVAWEPIIVTALPAAPLTSRTYFVDRADGFLDHWITDNAANYRLIHSHPIEFTDPAIYTHQAGANTSTEVINQALALPYAGDYRLTLSFNYNNDIVNSDAVVYATWGGNALDLDNRSGDPQGANQILRVEVKDSAAGPGGAITGTGSGQKLDYAKVFTPITKAAGNSTLSISIGSEGNNVETSIWNFVAIAQFIG